ncbi:lipoate--protein ligase family protein [Psychrobacillus sp. Sa2BUA9]|uniref:Octanoyltransferase LipM n=1 Tax=Psychrobacillus faecigallinarum TaxID=2762235 RepID=A0ABR8R8C6_9BACI|nr:biotin/lipoate A/B protein ligase family protein [Psychrobacillus faecigallinarum]MBD7943902.1 lipoate--protein ligase family protein [Psychrobacillus faecigallinarum]
MEKTKWYFIDSGPCAPSYNMALDEALLDWHSEGLIPPVIRFYEWNPATLSIGYFQSVEKEIDMEAVRRLGLGFVRRPTGGRGVLHEHELTYSVIVSEDYPDMPATVTEAYRVISEGLLKGFQSLGLEAYFSIPNTPDKLQALKNPKTAVCFDTPSWYELVVEGKKVAGSAQTRQKGVILQHGAILLDLDDEKLVQTFKFSTDEAREKVKKSINQKAVAINKLLQKPIPIDMCKVAFRDGFSEALNVELVPFSLNEKQIEYVKTLEKRRYANDEWNLKK